MIDKVTHWFVSLVNDQSPNPVDVGAGGITLAAFFQVVPKITAVLSLVWVAMRIYVSIRDDFINRKGKSLGNE